MGWKDWSYWLKGGLIGLFLTIVFLIIALPTWTVINWDAVGAGGTYNTILGSKLLGQIIVSSGFSILLVPILLAALIGYIYGKIKSKKQITR